MIAKPDAATAFRRLKEFASKVATELVRARVPHDTYVSHKSHQRVVTKPAGLFRRSKSEVVTVPEQLTEIGGWRVFSIEQEENLFEYPAGHVRAMRYTHRTLEVWLLRSGELAAVELLAEELSEIRLGGADKNVIPTQVDKKRALDYRTARMLDGRTVWREKRTKEGDTVRLREWRHYYEPDASTPHCVTLSKHLATLRARAG